MEIRVILSAAHEFRERAESTAPVELQVGRVPELSGV